MLAQFELKIKLKVVLGLFTTNLYYLDDGGGLQEMKLKDQKSEQKP